MRIPGLGQDDEHVAMIHEVTTGTPCRRPIMWNSGIDPGLELFGQLLYKSPFVRLVERGQDAVGRAHRSPGRL